MAQTVPDGAPLQNSQSKTNLMPKKEPPSEALADRGQDMWYDADIHKFKTNSRGRPFLKISVSHLSVGLIQKGIFMNSIF